MKQTKKLIAIFVVMAITMFAVIKANAEINPVYDEFSTDRYRYVESTELNEIVTVPINKMFVKMGNQEWEQWCGNCKLPSSNWKRRENTKTLKASKLKKDTLELLNTYGAFYIYHDSPHGALLIRVWKESENDKIYFKSVSYSPHRMKLPKL